jgi:hypothetical protein
MLGNWVKRNLGMVSFLAFMLLILSSLIYSFGNGQRKLSDIVIHIIDKIPSIERKTNNLTQYSKNNLKPDEAVYTELKKQISDLDQTFEREVVWIDLQPKDNKTNQILDNYSGLISGLKTNLSKQNQGIVLQSEQLNNWQEINKLQNLDEINYSELNNIIKSIEKILEKLDYSSITIQDINSKAKALSEIESQKIIVSELKKITENKILESNLSDSDKELIRGIYKNELPKTPQIIEIKRETLFSESVENYRQAIIDQIKDYLK